MNNFDYIYGNDCKSIFSDKEKYLEFCKQFVDITFEKTMILIEFIKKYKG